MIRQTGGITSAWVAFDPPAELLKRATTRGGASIVQLTRFAFFAGYTASTSAAQQDASVFGAGFLRVNADGTVDRLDPRQVQVYEDAPLDGADGLGPYYDR